jgi:hypothetical protein
MFALVQQTVSDGPWLVHDLFVTEPELHPELAQHLYEVSDVVGVALGWERKADGSFVPYVPPLADVKPVQIQMLRAQCAGAIVSGFTSSALGKPYTYGSSDTDQANLGDDVVDAQASDANWRAQIWCADAKGAWSLRDHDAKQVAAVFSDFRAMRAAAQAKCAGLTERVTTAKSVDIVRSVTWG